MLEIKNIPTGLILYAVQQWLPCAKYAKGGAMAKNTNTFLKAVCVWLILKTETPSGKIKNYRQQLPALAAKCKMSTRTLEKYINWLRKEKFAVAADHDLLLQNYKALRRYGIDFTERLPFTIKYNINDDVQLSEIIISVAMLQYKERWLKMYHKKLKQNTNMYNELYNLMIQCKADPARLAEPGYFRECHLQLLKQSFEEESCHSQSFELLHKDLSANPDLNARADTYAFKFGYGGAMGFCHLKKRLMKKGLIEIYERTVEGRKRAHKDPDIFHVRYSDEKKCTIWFMCDRIEILSAKFLQNKAAA